MEKPTESQGETPVFRRLNELVRRELPFALYERDLFLGMIDNKKLQMRARTFSRDVMGGDGAIHLSNHDYRLLLGVLASSFVLLKDKKNVPADVILSALETYESGCQPGADALSARIQSLVEFDHEDIRCSVRRRVRDIIRLLEVSYPLGTSITDPDGGDEVMVRADRQIRTHSFIDSVEEHIRMTPVRSATEIASTNQRGRSILAVRTGLEENSIARAGRDQRYGSFFGIPNEAGLTLQPEIDLGASCFPGTLVIARQSGHIAVMVKNVLCYASPAEDESQSATEGGVAVKTKPASSTQRDEFSVTTLCISKPDQNGGHDPEHPDLTYDFYDVSDTAPMTAFGKTVRKEKKERSST